MTLYKYTHNRWLAPLLNEGSIHIETLENLKKIEEKEIGDAEEGNLTSVMNGHTIDPSNPSSVSPQLSRVLNSGKLIISDQITIRNSFNEFTDNCYVLSLSKVLSRKLMKQMNKEVCVCISSAEGFFSELDTCMRERLPDIRETLIDKVEYVNKTNLHHLQTSNLPIFTKEKQPFFHQQEYRIVWTTSNPSLITPKTFACSGIKKFLSVVM